jgi:plastocyanin
MRGTNVTAAAALLAASALAATGGCSKKQPAAPAPAAPAPVAPAAAPIPAPAEPAPAAAGDGSRVEVAITEEGFVPSRIAAQVGKPLTLALTRKTDKTCATEILFAGQEGKMEGKMEGKTDLPLGKTVEVTYTPKAAGEVKFGCAMGMMIGGVLTVK